MVSSDRRGIRIEVEGDGGPWSTAPDEPTGRHGLDILRSLAKEWGITGTQTARTIWARFDWSD